MNIVSKYSLLIWCLKRRVLNNIEIVSLMNTYLEIFQKEGVLKILSWNYCEKILIVTVMHRNILGRKHLKKNRILISKNNG